MLMHHAMHRTTTGPSSLLTRIGGPHRLATCLMHAPTQLRQSQGLLKALCTPLVIPVESSHLLQGHIRSHFLVVQGACARSRPWAPSGAVSCRVPQQRIRMPPHLETCATQPMQVPLPYEGRHQRRQLLPALVQIGIPFRARRRSQKSGCTAEDNLSGSIGASGCSPKICRPCNALVGLAVFNQI